MLFQYGKEEKARTVIISKFMKTMEEDRKKPVSDRSSSWMVVPVGIEPTTHGFSVHCSTN